MTDWGRVGKLRAKGATWDEIAEDERVGFQPEKGTDPGRALKALYLYRRSRSGGRVRSAETGPVRKFDLDRLRLHRKGLLIGLVAVGAVALLLGYLFVVNPAPPGSNVVTYCGGEGTAAHYHPLLVIDVNGVQQPLPYDPSQSADIGFIHDPAYTNPSMYCPAGGIHALHTHDGSGIIHAELPSTVPTDPPPTLGDFFTIWGQPLSSSQVWSHSGTVDATVHQMSTGRNTDYSADPASIPLTLPSQGPTSNPYPIPQGLIFNGQYGGGESGGGFSGEIIWLNVTA